MDEKSTWSPSWRTMDKVSWSPGIYVFLKTMTFLNILSSGTNFRINCKVDSITNFKIERQTPPSNSLKVIEFKTSYIKLNPPLFFSQQNMQWSYNTVHFHFTLCLRTRDYIKRLSQHPWYNLWMRVKSPHHYKVTALGSCVKWPSVHVVWLDLELHHFVHSLFFKYAGCRGGIPEL